jgi:hypothetical protein
VNRLGVFLQIVIVASVLASTATGRATVGRVCEAAGEWPRTADAAWTERVVKASGFPRIGCTGSALVVSTGRVGSSGHDLYVWARTTRRLGLWPDMRRQRVAGVTVFANRLLAAWHVGRRSIWVEAGPSTPRLLPLARLRKLIRATVTTR